MSSNEMNSSSDLQLLNTTSDSINTESDNDSGIVAIAKGNRIGSTASNSDEDHVFKERSNQSVNALSYATKHRVRFDDELPLSEQNMRKSCKKLFDTLFHQNKDGPTLNSSYNSDSTLLPSCHCQHFNRALHPIKRTNPIEHREECCAHSDLNINSSEYFDRNDSEMLLNTLSKSETIHQYPYGDQNMGKHMKRFNTLDNKKRNISNQNNKSISNEENHLNSVTTNCDVALNRIKCMSDRLESSSMVNAYARPAFIKSSEYSQTMDTLYETIYPTEENSSNIHVNQWLNNNRVEEFKERERSHTLESKPSKNKDLNSSLLLPTKLVIDSKKSTLYKEESSDVSQRRTLRASKSLFISADQVYPDEDDFGLSDDEREECVDSPYDENISQRFSNSYSAGDDVRRSILRNRLKSAISETNLNQTKINSPNRKTFLQRFKSVITRAFTTDKINKTSFDNNSNCKSLSHMDLTVGMNSMKSILKNSKTSINRSPSFVKNLRTRMSLRRNTKENSIEKIHRMSSDSRIISENHKNISSKRLLDFHQNDCQNNRVWGELIKLNSDSSQVIQIHRQKGKAFGFFVARGTVNNVKGVFVSRMKDELTQKSLTGVLEIGDEILAIDGESVKDANIMRVNQLIANKEMIRLTIIPYMNNKYL